MILKKIARLCKDSGSLRLFQDEDSDQQWLSDGYAAYVLGGLPELSEKTVAAVLDLSEKEREKMSIRCSGLPAALNFGDEDGEELPVRLPDLGLVYGGRALLPVKLAEGVELIEPKYLDPLKDTEGLEWCERRTAAGQRYLAAKAGWMLLAVILPKNLESFPGLPEKLLETGGGLRRSMEALARAKAPSGQLRVDPETGEVTE